MIIRTSQDAAAVECCGCLPPACAAPRKECESISGAVNSVGFFNYDQTDWKIYRSNGRKKESLSSGSDEGSYMEDGDPVTYTSETRSNNVSSSIGYQYPQVYAGSVGSGEACQEWSAEAAATCDASGTSSFSSYAAHGYGTSENYTQYVAGASTYEKTLSEISGTETQEHSEWVDRFTDAETWQAEHDGWQTRNDAYTAWQSDPESGPEPPAPGEEPPARPAELYGPCSFKITHTFKILDGYWGKNSDGTSSAPDRDDEALKNWYFGPQSTGPPAPGTVVYETFTSGSNAVSDMQIIGFGDLPPATSEDYYLEPSNYSQWVTLAKDAVDGAMDFDNEECVTGENCSSTIQITPEPEGVGAQLTLSAVKARYRFGVPADFSTSEKPRSIYQMQWDEVFFPTGYDAEIDDPDVTPPDPLPDGWQHPQIADPDAPQPSLVASREWTWNGSMSNPWSEWFEIEIPAATGETRVVNVLVKCYQSARLGVKPTAHGDTYPLPE